MKKSTKRIMDSFFAHWTLIFITIGIYVMYRTVMDTDWYWLSDLIMAILAALNLFWIKKFKNDFFYIYNKKK